MTDPPSNSLAQYLDTIELQLKRTGVFASVEIIAYRDGHAAIGTHPLNDKEELLLAVAYLFDRAHAEAVVHKALM
jgi:hypothetical protein